MIRILPNKEISRYDFDLVCIGSGSAIGVVATALAQQKQRVAIVEAGTLGGNCPSFSCIPTKTLLNIVSVCQNLQQLGQYGVSADKLRIDYQYVLNAIRNSVKQTGVDTSLQAFQKLDITVFQGYARFLDKHTISFNDQTVKGRNFVIASGSYSPVPKIPGLEECGFLDYKRALELTNPPASIFIIGGSETACEYAEIFKTFGAHVYLADIHENLLAKEDDEVGAAVLEIFQNKGISVHLKTEVLKVEPYDDNRKLVTFKEGDVTKQIATEQVMVALDRLPNTDLDLDKAGINHDASGIRVNTYLQTDAGNIYAAGDVVGPYMTAAAAYYQSQIITHNLTSKQKIKANYIAVPRCLFLNPQVATVGLTEMELNQANTKFRKVVIALNSLGHKYFNRYQPGFVKVVCNQKGTIMGGSIIAPQASEMIAGLTLATNIGLSVEDIADTIHVFPTMSEAISLACKKLANEFN